MLTVDQSNYLHELMREMEKKAKQKLGLDVHFGLYMRSKKVSRLLSEQEAVALMANAMNVDMDDLKSPSRKPAFVMARKVIVAVMRATYKISLKDVADMLGRTDHTTALNLLTSATNLINTEDAEFMNLYEIAKKSLEI